jgi:hypothetical protein
VSYRQENCNLRRYFETIIKRAGLEPWQKLLYESSEQPRDRAGIETTAKSCGKPGHSEKSAAKSAAVSAGIRDDVRDLAAFLAKLPVKMREALMAVADAGRFDC